MNTSDKIVDDNRFQEFVINKVIPFPVMLSQADLKGYSYDRKCFCPFHYNLNTPSAKIYKDSNGRGDSLWCFSEQKMFYPVDVIKRNLIDKSVNSVFSKIWCQVSDDVKDNLVQLYGKPINLMPDNWDAIKKELELFRSGDIDYKEYLSILNKLS